MAQAFVFVPCVVSMEAIYHKGWLAILGSEMEQNHHYNVF
jgi:hypothetical protein